MSEDTDAGNTSAETDADTEKVVELMRESRVAMLTHTGPDGRLVSHPMATQDVEFDGTVHFIAERSSTKVEEIEANPQVNVSYSNSGSWVSLSGRAEVRHDEAKLKELWSTFSDAWLTGGPENPDNVLVEITPDSAEYWNAPGGSTVVQLANLVKSKVTGKRIEGDNATVEM